MSTSSPLAPAGLLCDLLAHPELTKIATTTPTFGWMVNGGRPGLTQSAYQILVSDSAEKLQKKEGNFWDTGRVELSQSISIHYAGHPLQPGGSYHWSVRTWDRQGQVSPWAEPQSFTLAQQGNDPVSAYPLQVVALPPVKAEQRGATLFVDFGRDAFGWLELRGELPPRNLTIRLGEKLLDGKIDAKPGGTIRYAEVSHSPKSGAKVHRVETPPDERNRGPQAVPIPEELGIILPFRYVEIEGLSQDFDAIERLRLMRVQYLFDETAASFSSSDPRLDDVWKLCHYTILATTFCGYYVDGDRERIPYEADAYINQLGHYACDREFSLARRTHEYLLRCPTWPTEWWQHSILIAWADYEATLDARSLSRCYEILKKDKLLLHHARPDGLVKTDDLKDIVDWPPVERDSYEMLPINTVVNAFHHRTLVLMARIARVLSKEEDAELFEREAEKVEAAFNAVLLDPGTGLYVDGEGSRHSSQHANFFPLAFGLVPKNRLRQVLAYVISRGMACSVYPAQFLLEGLFEAGAAEAAIALMTSDDIRSWHNMIRQGTTMAWEAWDMTFKPNLDWNHAWGAPPANILPRYILGVRPAEPGYGKVVVQPQLGPLNHAEGVIPTIRGPIHVRAWKDESGQTQHEVHVPANVEVVKAP